LTCEIKKNDDHLKELGLPLGARLKLLKAIKALNSASEVSASAPRGEAERRQLTVMFVDLVGSTELSLKLDPEELRDLSRAYQDATAREVGRYGGYMAKFMGDGVLVYFGYPQAHEDDAVRAIYAGLAVVRAVKRLGKRILAAHGGRLRARVDIATGVVVAGDLVGAEAAEVGAVTGEDPKPRLPAPGPRPLGRSRGGGSDAIHGRGSLHLRGAGGTVTTSARSICLVNSTQRPSSSAPR
jgi:Adenylate and Guanylate cyclase catalytic domain